MRKLVLVVLIFLILTLVFIVIINYKNNLTGNIILSDKHHYTTAICNETNYCADYEITCENNTIINKTFTGAAVQYPESWQDPRNNETTIAC